MVALCFSCSLLSVPVEAQVKPMVETHREGCSVNASAWTELIAESMSLFKNMDQYGFEQKRANVHAQVHCLSEILTNEQVAWFHWMEVLAAFAQKDKALLGAHVRASKRVAPDMDLRSEGLVNDGHPMLQWYAFAVDEQTNGVLPLPKPTRGNVLYVDGQVSEMAPTDLPYIVQRVKGEVVEQSAFVSLGAPPPEYPLYHHPFAVGTLEPTYFMTSSIGGAVTLLTMGLASMSEKRFWNPATPNEDLQSLQRRTNTYSTLAILGGVTCLSAGFMSIYADEVAERAEFIFDTEDEAE